MIEHKKCECTDESWEEIVGKDDDYFPNRTVIYFHCDACGEDFRVEDFETGEELEFPNLGLSC
jgi:hypothetical protein